MGLTVAEAFSFIATERKTIESKVAESVKFKLKKVLPKHEVEDLVSEAMVNTMERLQAGKVAFEDEKKLMGYLLYSCWFNYRDANKKKSVKLLPLDDWELEGLQLLGRDNAVFTTLTAAEDIAANPDAAEATEQDLSDTYYQELTEKVFAHLEECVMNEELKFRDVGLFKMYLVNGYTSAKQLSEASDFNLETCKKALSKIKKRLKPIKFN